MDLAIALTRPNPRAGLGRAVELSILGPILALALVPRLWNLDAYTGSFDEGIRAQQLLLMSAGYRPFRDIFASQGPLLLDLLYPFYLLFGQTLEAARAGVVACSLVGLLGAWWIGRLVAGPAAGLAAAALLALSPGYLEGSRLALAEVPTIAPALLAIGAALAYRGSGRRRWLVASAALCASALLIKPMVVHVGVPLVALLLSTGTFSPPDPDRARPGRPPPAPPELGRGRGRSPAGGGPGARGGHPAGRRAADLAIYGAVVAGLSALVVLALGSADVWDNLGAYRSGAGGRPGEDWAESLRLVTNVMARERAGLFALAAVGLLLGGRRRPGAVLPIALWAGAILGLFLLYGDLADKHIVYLVPPLALLGGIAVGLTAAAARTLLTRGSRLGMAGPGRPGAVLGVAALAVYLWNVPALYRADRHIVVDAEAVAERRRDLAAELDMAAVIRTEAGPGEWVLADHPGAAFRAGRPVIPSLVDTSGTRIDAGSLTAQQAIDAVARYRPAVIITWARRLGRLDPFTRWLPANGYRLDRTYDNGWKLYLRSG